MAKLFRNFANAPRNGRPYRMSECKGSEMSLSSVTRNVDIKYL
jgi:hypothetical protein